MSEKVEWLRQLDRQQSRLTLDLSEWMISQFSPLASRQCEEQAARLQRWVGLLVQSLLESVRQEEPSLVADFVVVLREREKAFFEPLIWKAAFSWLGCRCHRLLKSNYVAVQRNATDFDQELYELHWHELGLLLGQLDRALQLGVAELTPNQPPLRSLFQLRKVTSALLPAIIEFSVN